MENKETKSEEIIVVKNIEEKESKAGRKYFSVNTDKGAFSCFEFDLITELKKNIGNKVEVEIAENDRGFKNIRKFIRSIETVKISENKEIVEARSMKDQAIYTSYAKDLFIELIKDPTNKDIPPLTIMGFAIDLIKQARDSFK